MIIIGVYSFEKNDGGPQVPFKGDSFPESWVCLVRVLVCAYTNKLKGSSSISPNGVTLKD